MTVAHAGTPELVVLLNDEGQPIGTADKATVHSADTPLHLAFSVYVFDSAGRFLVTRRALGKQTWPGVWTNTCCGHPGVDEDLETAVRRRLDQELGLKPLTLQVALPDFAYRAESPEGLVENERCPVFVATVDHDPTPDPDEIAEFEWISWVDFVQVARIAPWSISPWSAEQALLLPTPAGE